MPEPKARAADPIDARLVRRLAAILNDTGLTEIEVERGDLRIKVARNAPGRRRRPTSTRRPRGRPASSRRRGRRARGEPRPARGRRRQLADGRHHLSAARAGRAAVRAGRRHGDAKARRCCIVEAMKTMNPIPAPRAGARAGDAGRRRPAGGVRRAAGRHRVVAAHVREDPHRQPGRDRAAGPPRLQGDGHRDGGGAFRGRRQRHARAPGRRERLHRPRARSPRAT